MIVLPIGHDKEIFHFPYATVGIMALCLAVQIYAAVTAPGDREQAESQQLQQLRGRIWREHGVPWVKEHHPELLQGRPHSAQELMRRVRQLGQAQQEFFAELDQGRVVAPDHPDLAALRRLERRKHERQGVLRLGYRWGGRPYTLVTYAFVHAGWFHLIGNLIFLYICGCNIEDRWGRGVWVTLYLLGGVAAALTWGALHRGSPVPLVGASGAIAAAMGAFLVVAARAEIEFFYFVWLLYPIRGTFFLKAYWALPLWLLQQLVGTWLEGAGTPVAYSAHVGGFVFGALAALALRALGVDRRLQRTSEEKATLYSEHPLFLEGLSQLQREETDRARATLERLLAEKPDHLDGAVELYRLQREPGAAARAASRAVVLARRTGDLDTAVKIYADVRQRHPGAALDERGLFAAAESLDKTGDPRGAVAAYERLLELHGDSPVAPRAQLNAARLYMRLSSPEQARQLLTRLLQQHGNTPFGDQARELLQQL